MGRRLVGAAGVQRRGMVDGGRSHARVRRAGTGHVPLAGRTFAPSVNVDAGGASGQTLIGVIERAPAKTLARLGPSTGWRHERAGIHQHSKRKASVNLMDRIGIAVLGAGYWGPNLVRNVALNPETELRWVCDLDVERASRLANTYAGARHRAPRRGARAIRRPRGGDRDAGATHAELGMPLHARRQARAGREAAGGIGRGGGGDA